MPKIIIQYSATFSVEHELTEDVACQLYALLRGRREAPEEFGDIPEGARHEAAHIIETLKEVVDQVIEGDHRRGAGA